MGVGGDVYGSCGCGYITVFHNNIGRGGMMKGERAYKIVTLERNSGYLFPWIEEENKYILSYKVGEVVEALLGTLGIFCFSTLKDAVRYHRWGRDRRCPRKIIAVEGWERRYKIPDIAFANYISLFYNKSRSVLLQQAPEGTALYQKIKVIT